MTAFITMPAEQMICTVDACVSGVNAQANAATSHTQHQRCKARRERRPVVIPKV
jgi:hypothetical protein